jgi:hypothetical protein
MDGTTPTVYRQPYPGLLFGICYLITRDETLSMEITAVIQILLGSIAIYVMMLLCRYICEDITGNNTISYRAMYLYLILCVLSLHTLFYDGAILSDGPAIAFISFFSYSYYQYLIQNEKTKYLLISGIFISLVTLYRPYYIAFYPILILHLGYHLWKNNKTISFIILRSFYIVLPFIFMNLPWTIRNYVIFHKFMPFYDLDIILLMSTSNPARPISLSQNRLLPTQTPIMFVNIVPFVILKLILTASVPSASPDTS